MSEQASRQSFMSRELSVRGHPVVERKAPKARTVRRLPSFAFVVPIVAALVGAGCAFVRVPSCGPGEDASVSDLLYFGTARPNGRSVTAAEWADFLAVSVTPRFPQGLTVWQATGQWKGADGDLVREPSFVLNLVHPAGQHSEDAIRSVVVEYKVRFDQEAVLRVKSSACMTL